MKRPETSTLIAGYPLVTVPLFGLPVLFGYHVVIGNAPEWVALVCLLFAGWLAKCSEEASRYRAWKREWNALDPNYRPPRPVRATLRFIGQLIVAIPMLVGFFWILADFNDPTSPARLVAWGIGAAIPTLWVAALLLSRRKRRPKTKQWIVTQAISRSLPAPSVAEAYARLPDYCRPLLTRENRKEQS